MKRTFKIILNALALILSVTCLAACTTGGGGDPGDNSGGDRPDGRFKMIATVTELGEKITVDVTEAEYTSGIHWVIVAKETEFTDKDGNKISLSDIKVGDSVEIAYSGQVMMSLPPQIVAASIKRL